MRTRSIADSDADELPVFVLIDADPDCFDLAALREDFFRQFHGAPAKFSEVARPFGCDGHVVKFAAGVVEAKFPIAD